MLLDLSTIGLLNGLTQSGLLIFGCILGFFFISKSKKTQAKLLLYLGLGSIGIGFWQLAGSIDFIHLLATKVNLPLFSDPNIPFSSLFWYFTTLFGLLFGIAFLFYSALKLVIPKKRYYFLTLYLIIGVIISIIYVGFFQLNIDLIPEVITGDDIINTSVRPTSPIFPLMICDVILFFIFNVIGLLLRSFKSKGIIKKKLIELSTANLLFLIFFVIYVIADESIYKFIMRIGEIGSIIIMYFALREAQEKPEKKRPKKEVKVKDGLFRLIRRPDVITEEEVSISKEKKICLVCKGKVLSFSFICPVCETFYCENCVKAIIDMENTCWACNEPLDESKPFKPYKKQEKDYGDLTKTDPKLKK